MQVGSINPTVVILAGGYGTRIKSLYPDIPKILIPIAGRPFIEWLLEYFISQGLKRFIFCLGHLAEVFEKYLEKHPHPRLDILTVREDAPLGTGGALLLACKSFDAGSPFVVSNGDSLVLADLSKAFELMKDPKIDGALLGVHAEDASRYGTLHVSPQGDLLSFIEKRAGSGTVNAGVYFFKSHLLNDFPERVPLSIEADIFPRLLNNGARISVCHSEGSFIDIGTPDALQSAQSFINRCFPFRGML